MHFIFLTSANDGG